MEEIKKKKRRKISEEFTKEMTKKQNLRRIQKEDSKRR